MTETKEQRQGRVRMWGSDQRVCARCGYKRINVRHEPDPEHAPEGADFYRAIKGQMHPFAPL